MQKICVIIPCYNEEERFSSAHFKQFVAGNSNYDFCFVNDGSTDKTASILLELSRLDEARIEVVDLKQNVGKAEAIRQALLICVSKDKYEYIGYIDADFSAPLEELNHIISFCHGRLKHGIIAGSRVKRLGANIVRSSTRHYLGRVFATIAGSLLQLPIYDSQCGLKLIRIDFAKTLFNDPFITKWLFDLELWLRLRNKVGAEAVFSETLEVPLNDWQEKGGSKLHLINFLTVPFDLFRIHFKYNTNKIKNASAFSKVHS